MAAAVRGDGLDPGSAARSMACSVRGEMSPGELPPCELPPCERADDTRQKIPLVLLPTLLPLLLSTSWSEG
eukprot:5072715-Pyramimonas_sp.AAC.1